MNIIFLVISFAVGFMLAIFLISYKIKTRPDGILLIDTSRIDKDIYRFVFINQDLKSETFALFRVDANAHLDEIVQKTSTFMDT